MEYFFISKLENNQVFLVDQEAKHCAGVLRKSSGDAIIGIDGSGMEYQCILTHVDTRTCIARILHSCHHPKPGETRLNIAISPLRQLSRLEVFAEKCAELGVDKISPIICQRSVKKTCNSNRLKKILKSGMKQSKRYYQCALDETVSFDHFVNASEPDYKYIATCEEGLKRFLPEMMKGNIVVLIGPEGDFTKEEYQRATECGFIGINLGDFRYRTETAGIIVATMGRS